MLHTKQDIHHCRRQDRIQFDVDDLPSSTDRHQLPPDLYGRNYGEFMVNKQACFAQKDFFHNQYGQTSLIRSYCSVGLSFYTYIDLVKSSLTRDYLEWYRPLTHVFRTCS